MICDCTGAVCCRHSGLGVRDFAYLADEKVSLGSKDALGPALALMKPLLGWGEGGGV